jgi:TIR domain-containing protein
MKLPDNSGSPIYMGFKLTTAEKVWLEAVYTKLRKNEKVIPAEMRAYLWEKIPKDFEYKDIDQRLILFGVDITLLGILQIDSDTDLVSKTDTVIRWIRQAIIDNPTIASANSEAIADSTGLSKYEVSFIFGLLSHLGNFWNGGASDTTGHRQINIGYEPIFREYLNYENIDDLLLKMYQRKDLRQIHTSEDEQLETLPLTPSKVIRGMSYHYEVSDFYSEEDFQQLAMLMFEYPDRMFYLFKEADGRMSELLLAKEDLGEIVFPESEYFYYKIENRRFIHIEVHDGKYRHYQEKEIVEKGPMYIRSTMQISKRKRMEMETWLKIELEELYRKEYHKRMNTYDVFISYAAANTSEANKLYEAVQQAGGRAFLAAKGINPGEDFADKIRDALAGSTELWLLASPNSLQSDWVVSEWGAAWALKKPIIPILHRCSVNELPDRLQRLQVIDFYRYQELIDTKKGGWVAT